MDFLHGLAGFIVGLLIFVGPWAVILYVVSRFYSNLKVLNQSVVQLQGRVKELEEKGNK